VIPQDGLGCTWTENPVLAGLLDRPGHPWTQLGDLRSGGWGFKSSRARPTRTSSFIVHNPRRRHSTPANLVQTPSARVWRRRATSTMVANAAAENMIVAPTIDRREKLSPAMAIPPTSGPKIRPTAMSA
jgi:hypothetical protein